jgi:hypothetical protein
MYFQQVCDNNGFWSCCGYDGLAVVFDLPLESLQSLPDDQKRALMRLLVQLAGIGRESLRDRVREIERLPIDKRLTVLVDLSTQFAA